MAETYTADRKLWLTVDREHVVEDGDPRAAFLLASKGKTMPLAEAKRFGLVGEPKQAAKPQDKQRARAQDKAGEPGRKRREG